MSLKTPLRATHIKRMMPTAFFVHFTQLRALNVRGVIRALEFVHLRSESARAPKSEGLRSKRKTALLWTGTRTCLGKRRPNPSGCLARGGRQRRPAWGLVRSMCPVELETKENRTNGGCCRFILVITLIRVFGPHVQHDGLNDQAKAEFSTGWGM